MRRRIVGLLLALNLLVALAAVLQAVPSPEERLDVAAIRARVGALELKAEERVWDRIAWQSDPARAMDLARQTGRPVFLFSMYGELDGRC